MKTSEIKLMHKNLASLTEGLTNFVETGAEEDLSQADAACKELMKIIWNLSEMPVK